MGFAFSYSYSANASVTAPNCFCWGLGFSCVWGYISCLLQLIWAEENEVNWKSFQLSDELMADRAAYSKAYASIQTSKARLDAMIPEQYVNKSGKIHELENMVSKITLFARLMTCHGFDYGARYGQDGSLPFWTIREDGSKEY